jgi:hypothetical protein
LLIEGLTPDADTETAILAWLVDALEYTRSKGQTKVVGYLEEVPYDIRILRESAVGCNQSACAPIRGRITAFQLLAYYSSSFSKASYASGYRLDELTLAMFISRLPYPNLERIITCLSRSRDSR